MPIQNEDLYITISVYEFYKYIIYTLMTTLMIAMFLFMAIGSGYYLYKHFGRHLKDLKD
ncbi:hypothetical protein [Riemerella anatipestifer]|uniref:hypothetical protein n=1 Tax=Riemerella anatipestifer TaxID=34085 RepID=UPI0021D5FB56|nr:hypothetical protein [Riemerella anatipestifer]MCU7542946.1 hypothetical protein [Riemerella anatipestifer]MCW0513695.1 hypothetical protein [Riemerella anatipestifer]